MRKLTDEELEALMPWSEQYKAYEKHEIESRYEGITISRGITHKPEDIDIQKMRLEMEVQQAMDSAQSSEVDNLSTAASDNVHLPTNEEQESLSNSNISDESNDVVGSCPSPEEESSMVGLACPGKDLFQEPQSFISHVPSESPQESISSEPWSDLAERKTG